MYCRICGSENNLKYRERSRMALCDNCHRDTPKKVKREEFDRKYWGNNPSVLDSVAETTKQNFFDDYMKSEHTLESYIESTTDKA